jgi:outer membrane lipoprotein LolB
VAPVALDPAAQRALLQGADAWTVNGRIAGSAAGEGFNAQLTLRQQGEETRLQMRSPLGLGSASVRIGRDEVEFSSSRGEKLHGAAALQALNARLGFDAPVASLRYWVLGVPDPSGGEARDQAAGSFEQSGWNVTVAESLPANIGGDAVQIPRRVTIQRENVRLRILIEKFAAR